MAEIFQSDIASTINDNILNPVSSAWDDFLTWGKNLYTGGLKTITDYFSGSKIYFGTDYAGAFFDGVGNFLAASSSGVLTVQSILDKFIDLSDLYGNSFVSAYEAFLPTVIDGRGFLNYEIIAGSNFGADIIFAGDGGSQLWGGADFSADTLFGGFGLDIFIGGRFQGADNFLNASASDAISFGDATLSDIISAVEINGSISINFNTGNTVTVQSSEGISAAIVLGDGSAYRFNHVTKSWQGA